MALQAPELRNLFRLLLFRCTKIPHYLSSTRVCITRVNRELYGRMYPVHLALPNGATIRIRYKEPRYVLQLPLDLDECDEEERARRLLRRKPRARLELQEDMGFEDSFDSAAYDFLWSKSKSK
ncbi:39S ribosomal protein L55, mitochondrial [Echinococcus granulosus]|uniref:39S ribosomal protein L55 n=1 Tax=Echinococcus granulosus TaxID=6210 RepID=U6JFQ1_ECHGR|nr:39S ribosomal protein L55 [Echinococcus granulosus]EUB60511.1 39S ribosomal protein L55 [Echinococcus granulosus]KAH9280094.1 39S ribosomal protein L55, mitochondrial [Echinococcus granulosus]CDS22907.1 mitochondrial ribosomal protein L55 [Echinococcus granulosus]